jgi:hypothetical protein
VLLAWDAGVTETTNVPAPAKCAAGYAEWQAGVNEPVAGNVAAVFNRHANLS